MGGMASGATHDSLGAKQRMPSPVAVQGLGSAGNLAARAASGTSWVRGSPGAKQRAVLATGTAPQIAAAAHFGTSAAGSGAMAAFPGPAAGTSQSKPSPGDAIDRRRLRLRRPAVPDPPPKITPRVNFGARALGELSPGSLAATSFAGTPLPPPPPTISELAKMTTG